MAGRPLRPATDRSLGGPLPRQLANRTQAALEAHRCFGPQAVCGISPSFPGLFPTSGHIPTRSSPVRHWRVAPPVRLACVRHAASVRSEPGSNSHVHQAQPGQKTRRRRCRSRAPLTTLDAWCALKLAPRTPSLSRRRQKTRSKALTCFQETDAVVKDRAPSRPAYHDGHGTGPTRDSPAPLRSERAPARRHGIWDLQPHGPSLPKPDTAPGGAINRAGRSNRSAAGGVT